MIKSLLMDIANITNDVVGVDSDYYRKGESEPYKVDIKIIIDNSKEVKGDFGVIVGYQPEAIILKSDIEEINIHDFFVQEDATYRINFISRETTGKYYIDVVEV